MSRFLLITSISLHEFKFTESKYFLFFRINLLTKPLQRIAVGGVLTAAAFFVSGFLELELEVSLSNGNSVFHSHHKIYSGLLITTL